MSFIIWLLVLQAGMTDDAALKKAETIWSTFAMVGKVRHPGAGWTYQVGCHFPRLGEHRLPRRDFIVAGEGDSWEAAFASVSVSGNGDKPNVAKSLGIKTAILCEGQALQEIR